MCDEHVDLWNQEWRKARKQHTCCECNCRIEAGSRYLAISTLYEGRWERSSLCEMCNAHWEFYRQLNDGCIMLGGLQEEEQNGEHETSGQFVIIDSTLAECIKEDFYENQESGGGAGCPT